MQHFPAGAIAAAAFAALTALAPTAAAETGLRPGAVWYRAAAEAEVPVSDAPGEAAWHVLTASSGVVMLLEAGDDGTWGKVQFDGFETGWVPMAGMEAAPVAMIPGPAADTGVPIGLECAGHAPGWQLTVVSPAALRLVTPEIDATFEVAEILVQGGAGAADFPTAILATSADHGIVAMIDRPAGTGGIELTAVLEGGVRKLLHGDCALVAE